MIKLYHSSFNLVIQHETEHNKIIIDASFSTHSYDIMYYCSITSYLLLIFIADIEPKSTANPCLNTELVRSEIGAIY